MPTWPRQHGFQEQKEEDSEGIGEEHLAATAASDRCISKLVVCADASSSAKGLNVEAKRVVTINDGDLSVLTLWDIHTHKVKTGEGQKLPSELRSGPSYAFTAYGGHWDATRPDYLQVAFTQTCKVYLLFVNKARVPAWVKTKGFRLVRECQPMEVEWDLELAFKIVAVMTQRLEECKTATMLLYESDKEYEPGVVHGFGGMGGKQLLDYTYVLLWRPLSEKELSGSAENAAEKHRRDTESGDGDASNRQRREEVCRSIVAHVVTGNLDMVKQSCRAYRREVQTEPSESGADPRHRVPAHGHGGGQRLLSSADGTAAIAVALPGARSSRFPGAMARPAESRRPPLRTAFVTRSGELLTSRAIKVDNCDPELVLYLVSQGAEINSNRNPIACAMVMAEHLLNNSSHHTTKTKEFRELGQKLRRLAACLVEKLERLVGSSASSKVDEDEEEALVGGAGRSLSGGSAGSRAEPAGMGTSLEDVLAPRGVALSINDAQPMQVAYDTQDDEFMSTGVVQEYCKAHWQGAAYQANALVEVHGESAVHIRDNRMVFKLFCNAGFVGSLGEPFMLIFSRMAHIMILSCRPYFESPRGRWAFRLMCEAILLYVFHAVQLMRSEDGITWQHLLLTLYVLSMVVDEAQEVAHKYQRRLAVYFTDGFNVIEAITILLLLGSGGCKLSTSIVPTRSPPPTQLRRSRSLLSTIIRLPTFFCMPYYYITTRQAGMLIIGTSDPAWAQLRTAKDFLFNTTAMFLWLRALQVLLPLVGGLGALLMVTSKMVWEVLKFAVLGMMVMMGVAFTMYGMYKERGVPAMDSFANVLLLLFRTFLGETMFDTMLTEKSTLYNLYGNIVVLVYTLAATVILANLLIAIISYHFKPEKVTHQLLGAPFSLPLLVAKALLPSGTRCMLGPEAATFMFSLGIMNLDGNPLQDESAESTFFATGSAELPYLVFLLTFFPMLIAATWALGLLMAPYCVFYFAVKGCNIWLPAGLRSLTTPWMLASMAGGGAKGSAKGGGGALAAMADSRSSTKVVPAGDQQADLQLLDALDEDEAADEWARAFDSPQQEGKLAQGAFQVLQLGLLVPQCVLFIVTRLIMAAVGALIYGGILIGFCTGTYQYLARIFFSCFWVLLGWMQVLTKDEIKAAMLEAGFAEEFVASVTLG
eukprot:XP_001703282.1 predicted protein [Chlamydomonas reinhardtii]